MAESGSFLLSMPISYQEPASITCPNCGTQFRAEVWLILDAQEHPEQVEELRQNRLNVVTCPQCAQAGPASVPLLFHHNMTRQVLFAPSFGAEEHVWQEQARNLHAILVGSIPLEERRAYLSDVQIAQDIAGIAHILNKTARRQAQAQMAPTTVAAVSEPLPLAQVVSRMAEPDVQSYIPHEEKMPSPDVSGEETGAEQADRLLLAVQELLAADTADEVQAVMQRQPVLLTVEADVALQQLADMAFEQREHEIAEGLRQVRQLLIGMRKGEETIGVVPELITPIHDLPPAAAPVPETAEPGPAPPELPPALYQALINVDTSDDLIRVTQEQPALLDPWVDVALSHTINQFLEESNESLAHMLEQRREVLAELRQHRAQATQAQPVPTPPTEPASESAELLQIALEALLVADDEDTLAQALLDYPLLLTEDAQQALWQLSSEARVQGNEELAVYAVECRAMLQKVREGLSENDDG